MMPLYKQQAAATQGLHNGDLPEGWVSAKLPEIAKINMGQSPPGRSYNSRSDGLPFFQGKTDFGERYPTVRVWCSQPKKTAHPGDLLISVRAPVGPTNVADRVCAIGRGLAAITPLGGIPSEFILFRLRVLEPELALSGTGSTFSAISRKDLEEIDIGVPPLPEQKRIVAKVEELLARVNTTKERLAKVSMILKRFRQAVLAAACSGHLTADWRDKQLHTNSSNQPLDGNEDLPSSWSLKSIRDLASSKRGSIQSGPFGSNLLHSEFQPTGILVIGIDNVLDGKFSFGKQHRISHQKYELLKKYAARPLDVLVTVMATVGRCCVVPPDIETAIITKHVYRITADLAVVNPYYLMQCIRGCPEVLAQVQSEIQGVTRPGINGAILKGINIPLPPITEQHEIVRRVEAMFKLADAVEKRVAAATARAEKLTQAILAKAFRGELVPTEAELAHRERRSYEPASKLLARIKSDKEMNEISVKLHHKLDHKKRSK
jgi:type I restriction enzyme S subunit